MSLTLHIEAASVAELIAEAQKFIGGGIGKTLLPMEEVAVGSATITDPATMKGKPGRPSKPKMEEAIAANTAAVAPAPVVEAPKPVAADPFAAETLTAPAVTFDQVKSALQKVAAKYPGEPGKESPGMEKVRVILANFNTFKVSALKPEQYAAVLEACGQA